jgi:hypothetical protein
MSFSQDRDDSKHQNGAAKLCIVTFFFMYCKTARLAIIYNSQSFPKVIILSCFSMPYCNYLTLAALAPKTVLLELCLSLPTKLLFISQLQKLTI